MKKFISLPVNGYSLGERKSLLEKAIKEIESAGHIAVCPQREERLTRVADKTGGDLGSHITTLLKCDAIYLLPRWYESRVCCSEKQVAENYDKKILFTIPEKR